MISVNSDGSIELNGYSDSRMISIYIPYIKDGNFFDNEYSEYILNINNINVFKLLYQYNIPYGLRLKEMDYIILNGKIIRESFHIFPNERFEAYKKYLTHENLKIFEVMQKV